MEGQGIAGSDEARQLTAAVRRNPVAWSAAGTPLMLLLVLLVMSFGTSREPTMQGSTSLVLLAFILLSLAEVALMPWFFINQAGRNLTLPLEQEGIRSFTNLYAIALLGGTTPCMLGLVYYVLSGNLVLALLLYAVGFAGLLYYGLRMDAVIGRLVPEAIERQEAN